MALSSAGEGFVAAGLVDAVLRSYSQIFFSRSRAVGALLLAATFVAPRLGVYGLASVVLANLTARALGFAEEEVTEGLYGYNALLVGLGGAAVFQSNVTSGALLALAVLATVLMTAATRSFLGQTFGIPILTVPFLATFYLLMAAGPMAGVALVPSGMPLTLGTGVLPAFLEVSIRSLGSVFFAGDLVAGSLVMLALFVYSRTGWLLAMMGFGGAWLLGQVLFSGSDPLLTVVLGYNLALTAIAVGGVWFVPSRASFALAALSVAVAGAVTVGLLPVMAALGLPLLILPLNLVVPLVLYAMRQRTRDARPKAVDFVPGTPEQNLRFYQSRVARFGSHFAVRLHAPFLGRWVVTQGVDGEHTHQGPWRHALDFEVRDADGRAFRGDGSRVADYLCYRLPVLACADGTVARVVDTVPDNPVGVVDTKRNWGNLVIVYHDVGLYSAVCHLAPGTVNVVEGQYVRQGDVLGLCGSSGRSPTPHLHFQLQSSAAVGAPTRSLELHDVVGEALDDGRERLYGTVVPEVGATLRNLDMSAQRVDLPGLQQGEVLDLVHANGRQEGIRFEIDLLGRRMLRSTVSDAALFFDVSGGLFTVYDVTGDRRSGLHALGSALSRVPLEGSERVLWSDRLDLRPFVMWPGSWLLDLAAPFARPFGVEMTYRLRHDGDQVVVVGESARRRGGAAWLTTEAALGGPAGGIRCVSITVGGRTTTLKRTGAAPERPAGAPAALPSSGRAA
jgi:urea transporter/murein DD-endopeptidase MepM/ murein hydrolase activator NlpD